MVVEDLLPEAFFRELAATIPPIEYFKQAKNGRKADLPIIATNKTYLETPEDFRATWGRLRDDVLHDTVAPVLAERLRDDVRGKFADLFSPEIADEVMGSDLVSSAGRIMLRKPGYKLGPHTDSAMYAITCLLYFTEADEESSGALCLFRPERRPELRHVSTYYPDEEEGIEAEVAKVIPIRENLFVAFVNGQESLHGVRVDADQPSNEFRMTYQAHSCSSTIRASRFRPTSRTTGSPTRLRASAGRATPRSAARPKPPRSASPAARLPSSSRRPF